MTLILSSFLTWTQPQPFCLSHSLPRFGSRVMIRRLYCGITDSHSAVSVFFDSQFLFVLLHHTKLLAKASGIFFYFVKCRSDNQREMRRRRGKKYKILNNCNNFATVHEYRHFAFAGCWLTRTLYA